MKWLVKIKDDELNNSPDAPFMAKCRAHPGEVVHDVPLNLNVASVHVARRGHDQRGQEVLRIRIHDIRIYAYIRIYAHACASAQPVQPCSPLLRVPGRAGFSAAALAAGFAAAAAALALALAGGAEGAAGSCGGLGWGLGWGLGRGLG